MLRLVWRLQRTGLIGMSAFGFLYGILQASAYNSAAGTSRSSRIAFGQQMETFGRQFSTVLPLPAHVDTLAGFLQWRVYGALPLLFGFWAVLSASGASRGDEDKGLVEMWLTSVVSRGAYLLSRVLIFTAALAIAVLATSLAVDLGAVAGGSPLDLVALLELALALIGTTLTCYAITLVVAQLTSSRVTAGGVGGGVIAVLFFINSFGHTSDNLRAVARFVSPFYHYEVSTPLAGGNFSWLSTLALFLAALVLSTLAISLMLRRDIGSTVVQRRVSTRPVSHLPARNPVLGLPVLEGVFEHRVGLMWWVLGSGVGAAYLASSARPIVDLFTSPSAGAFRNYLAGLGHGDPYVTITGFIWFGIFDTLLAVYVITRVSRWAADDNEGRLEMVLSAPVSRWRVVLERAAVLTTSCLILIAVSSVVLYLSASASRITLPLGDLAVASVALLPMALVFGGVGALFTSRLPRATVAVLTTIAFLSYLITELGPLLKAPDWVNKLSVFALYGTPLTSGIYWTGLLIMVSVTLAGFGGGGLLLQRRDVGA